MESISSRTLRLLTTRSSLNINSHVLHVTPVLADPLISVIENLATAEETQILRDQCRPALIRSRVVNSGTSDERTSSSCRVPRTHPVVRDILNRCAEILDLPVNNVEPVQVVHYQVGQEYRPHFDFFDAGNEQYHEHTSRGGQRVWTVFLYLSDCEEGGWTSFPKLELSFKPETGKALIWSNEMDNGLMDMRMLHGGEPILKGEKWGMNIWFRKQSWVQPSDPPESAIMSAYLPDSGEKFPIN